MSRLALSGGCTAHEGRKAIAERAMCRECVARDRRLDRLHADLRQAVLDQEFSSSIEPLMRALKAAHELGEFYS